MYSKILVPLDGSKTAEKALPYARYLAGKFKVPVELLAVVDIAEMASHMPRCFCERLVYAKMTPASATVALVIQIFVPLSR